MTTPALGSMVQNGKFSAPMPALVSALKRVDFPTLGKPTMPQLKPMKLISSQRMKKTGPDYTGLACTGVGPAVNVELRPFGPNTTYGYSWVFVVMADARFAL
ncbi:hypothetical protein, partial [Marinimicrobium sp. UBA4209]|uniref:hypothetical protein n=1 Tax=Marinimicrobium sp. UBA4209 TaxID=1946810 RepID=UPI00257AC30A